MDKEYIFNTKNYFTFCKCDEKKRGCVVVVPGGGYNHTSKAEAFNVANIFIEHGFHAAVLNYREEIISYPEPQKELAYVIDAVRGYDIVDSDKIICIGFSAGGHLSLSQACFHNEYGYNSRPNLLVLCYPVISSDEAISHKGSFEYLLKDIKTEELMNKMSLEKNIPSDLCDVFLWHNVTDESVSILNSIELMKALKLKNINFESHIFPLGVHGMSLADDSVAIDNPIRKDDYIAKWTSLMFDWINLKFKN